MPHTADRAGAILATSLPTQRQLRSDLFRIPRSLTCLACLFPANAARSIEWSIARCAAATLVGVSSDRAQRFVRYRVWPPRGDRETLEREHVRRNEKLRQSPVVYLVT